MEEVLNFLSKPLFWIISVVFSLALSIVGNLLTPKIAALIEQRNSAKQMLSMKAKAKRFGEVLLRFDSLEKVTQTMIGSLYAIVMACFFLIAAIGLLMLALVLSWFSGAMGPRIVLIGPCIPLIWLVQFLFGHGIQLQKIAELTRKRQRALEQFRLGNSRTTMEELDFLKEWDEKQFGITWEEAQSVLKKGNALKLPSPSAST